MCPPNALHINCVFTMRIRRAHIRTPQAGQSRRYVPAVAPRGREVKLVKTIDDEKLRNAGDGRRGAGAQEMNKNKILSII